MQFIYGGLMVVGVVMITYFIVGEKKVKDNSQKAKNFLNWMNTDMMTSVGVFAFCGWVWLTLNLDNGNVVALQKGWELLNSLSLTGLNPPDTGTLRIAAAVPSVIQWWLMQFNPEGSTRHDIGWLVVVFDVILTTIGYWLGAGLTTNVWELSFSHFILGIFFLICAIVVNAYLELIAHDSLARFWLTIRGMPAKGVLKT